MLLDICLLGIRIISRPGPRMMFPQRLDIGWRRLSRPKWSWIAFGHDDLRDLPLAGGTDQSMLIPPPLVITLMAKDHLSPGKGIQSRRVSLGRNTLGHSVSDALIRSYGSNPETDDEAGIAQQCSERQFAGLYFVCACTAARALAIGSGSFACRVSLRDVCLTIGRWSWWW